MDDPAQTAVSWLPAVIAIGVIMFVAALWPEINQLVKFVRRKR